MAPRGYTQRRRAEAAAATRRRILDAALELYLEHSVAGTTLTAVAQRADVSRGTILNHFGGVDGLLDAVVGEIIADLEFPGERVQEGAATEEERIRRYVDAMFRFFVRSDGPWPAFSRDLDHPILKAREAEYYEIAGRLFAATFQDLATDRVVVGAARAFVDYPPLNALRAAGLDLDETIEVVADALVDITRRRRFSHGGKA